MTRLLRFLIFITIRITDLLSVFLQKIEGRSEGLVKTSQPGPFIQSATETQYSKGSSAELFPIPNWMEEVQPFLLNQLSEHTRRAYQIDLKQFFRFLHQEQKLWDLRLLKPQHIIIYRKFMEEGRMHEKPLQKASVNRKLAVVKSFLNWLKLNQHISDNPAQLVKGYPQDQESSLKGLSDDEARNILSIPNRNQQAGSLHQAILHLLLYMGLRKGELIQLRMGDLAEERGIAVLKVRGKGHKVRILPLTPVVKSSLEWYFKACRRDSTQMEEPLFIPTKNPRTKTLIKMMNPHAITYIVKRYATKAGVLKKISPHSCRATCISNALDKKASQRSVQHLAGWSTPLMIQRYDKRREDLHHSAAYLIDYGERAAA